MRGALTGSESCASPRQFPCEGDVWLDDLANGAKNGLIVEDTLLYAYQQQRLQQLQ